jgi:hypothetical protein
MPIETWTLAWAGRARLVIPTNVTTLTVRTSVLRRGMMLSSFCNVNALLRYKIKEKTPYQWSKLPRVLPEVQEQERAGDRACQGHHRQLTRSQGAVLVMATRVPQRHGWSSPWNSLPVFVLLTVVHPDG